MGWDSNPRYACAYGGFQDRCLKPLGHPSRIRNQTTPWTSASQVLTKRDFRHHVWRSSRRLSCSKCPLYEFSDYDGPYRAFLLPAIAARAQPAGRSVEHLDPAGRKRLDLGRHPDRPLLRQWPAPGLDLANGRGSGLPGRSRQYPVGRGSAAGRVRPVQQIYTPADTAAVVPSPYDRPYAGVLLGNFSLMSDARRHQKRPDAQPGLVGPASGAEQLQNGFHDLIGQNHTNGWGSQIQNAPAVEVLHERTWRLPMGTVAGLETDALPSLTIGLGDLRDYLQTGVTFRLGQGLDSDFGVPRFRPGLSGGDAFTQTRPFAWYVFAGADGQAVGYDMLLQTSPFRGGPHVSTSGTSPKCRVVSPSWPTACG